jgi:AraC-like DNA-binding protein
VIFRHYKPRPPLAGFIDTIWHYEGYDTPHRMDRILPSGDMGVVINLRDQGFRVHDENFSGAILCGAYSEFFTIDTAQQSYTLGIHFKPGGAFPFLRIPAGELKGRHVDLSDVWGARAGEMRERLLAARSIEERFRIVEATLLQQMKPRREPHPAVGGALHAIERTHSVAEVSAQIGLSPKRFADVFREEVGLTPKLFFRIRRFQHVLRRMSAGQPVEWADFALSAGYYDQPHFNHDFQAFSGLNPSSYAPRPPLYINHVALPD